MPTIDITTRNLKLSKKLYDKIKGKILKHKKFLSQATQIKVTITKLKTQANKDIHELKISVKLPKAYIKVTEIGTVLENMLDTAENNLARRLKRYNELKRRWEGVENWKDIINENDYDKYKLSDEHDIINYQDFEPVITKRETYEDDTPRHPAEAIELMELLGRSAFLFKNIETGKYSMVYKLPNGTYGLIEPPSL